MKFYAETLTSFIIIVDETMKTFGVFLLSIAVFLPAAVGCSTGRTANTASAPADSPEPRSPSTASAGTASDGTGESDPATEAQTRPPRTVREFFMALPVKYFPLESCEPEKDKGCQKAKRDYLKTFLEVEDTANGYLKAGCDGAQSCLEMAIFKKPDGNYIVGLRSDFEMGSDSYFVDLNNGKWTDVGPSIVDGFSRDNYYAIPRNGTTVGVFEKLPETADPTDALNRGKKLYDLEWKNGKFVRR